MKISDLEYMEVVSQEVSVAGGINFNTSVTTNATPNQALAEGNYDAYAFGPNGSYTNGFISLSAINTNDGNDNHISRSSGYAIAAAH